MAKKLFAVLMVVISFLLQSTLFSQFTIGGACPNLLMIAVASLGFSEGKRTGIYAGFFSGILLDISFGSFYGMNALLYMYCGYLCGYFKKYIFTKDIKMPIILISFSDLLYSILFYFFSFMLNGKFHFIFYLKNIIIPEVIYTTLIACIIYPLIHSITAYIDRKEKGEQPIV